MNLLCFGCGYVAQHFARLILHKGGKVTGTTRDEANFKSLKAQGIQSLIFNDEQPLEQAILKSFSHILVSIPPYQESDLVINTHFREFKWLSNLKWLGYLSTTGVYGDHNGEWVTEVSHCAPTQARSQIRLQSEEAWLKLWQRYSVPVHIFRLSGIYGPKRNVFEQIKKGTARRLYKPEQVFSRIHVNDIAQTLLASIFSPQAGEIYNVADDEPASSADVISYAYHLLGLEPPILIPFEEAQLTSIAQEFYAGNKRVSNRKMKQELNINLLYPTYREGLGSMVDTYKTAGVSA
ncbi:MAG: SDR family oxidoreductase [Alphaproteobacteria bacterium]|nr:SDR family oxidoreductase [Alphaproteobacteria bacterium]